MLAVMIGHIPLLWNHLARIGRLVSAQHSS